MGRKLGMWVLLVALASAGMVWGESLSPRTLALMRWMTQAGLLGERVLEVAGRLEHPRLAECSGLVASRRHAGVFWAHNDSGHPAQLFAVDATGKHLGGPIEVRGAGNRDWEDIAMDGAGRLMVADLGNNRSSRRDLRLYVMPEPDLDAKFVEVEETHRVYYPEQTGFPCPARNFDCEAVFALGEEIYLFTKHRTDTLTRLYRMGEEETEEGRPLRLLGELEIYGPATAADVSPCGRRLALLALHELWVFEVEEAAGKGEDFLGGKVRRLTAIMGQAEAVAFDGPDEILVANEGREIYRIQVSEMRVVKE